MAVKKISYNRFKETTDRGFDIISNDVLYGFGSSKTLFYPTSKPIEPLWKRI